MTVAEAKPGRKKARLTITLSPPLLSRLDRAIDGHALRNRSQAIESLLSKALAPRVTTAVVLAGGSHGHDALPAMAPIEGQPLILRTLRHLVGNGIESFVVLAGTGRPALERFLGGGESLGAEIRYVTERRPRGTAGALKAAEALLADEPFLVIHGDVLTNIDIADFIRFHLRERTTATIAVKPRQSEPSYGRVLLQGNRITEFLDQGRDGGISIVNTGVYLFQPEVLDLIDERRRVHLETDVFPLLARTGELSAFLFQGIWFDIGTPERYRLAQQRWREKGGLS